MANNSLNYLHPDHLSDLRKSGLSDETILESCIKSVRPADINKIFGYETYAKSMYEIPYPGSGYSRYKIFYNEEDRIHSKTWEERPKYLCKKNSGNHLYFPNKVQAILKDSSIPIYITEGEKKSLKACQVGFLCIAIAGLWNWKLKDKDGLISDFDLIALDGRNVYIVPDSHFQEPDRHGKPKNLKQAVYGLAYKLMDKGANVSWVELPKGDIEIKLDDYLCSHTVEDFKKLPVHPIPEFDNFDNFDDSLRDIFENVVPEYSFPFEVFPERLQEIIKNYSEALSVEPEVIAHIMLVLSSAAIGNSTRIESKSSHVEPLFLWGTLIQPSGVGKTHAVNTLLKQIENKQAEAYQKYQEDLKRHSKYQKQLTKIMKKNKGDIIKANPDGIIDMEYPVFRQYIINDSTVEANADVFISQPRGVLLHNDELSSLPLGFGKYKKAQSADREHYLEIWNANPITINRVTTGVKYVPNTGMGIIGGLPTRTVTKIFSEDDIHNGLLPRFLHLLIDSKLPYNDKTISENDKSYWNNVIVKCYAIPLEINDKTGRVNYVNKITLNNEAFDLYTSFRNEYDQLLELLQERAKVFIPKLQTYCLRFAGILQILKTFDANKDINANTLINAEIMKAAIKLTRYYTHQADKLVRLYSPQEELKPHQIRLIKVIYKLKDEVRNGRLYLKRITEIYNEELPKHCALQTRHVGDILRKGLRLDTGISHDSYLMWNDKKLKVYFRNISKSSKSSKETDSKSDKTHLQAESASQQTPNASTRGESPQGSNLNKAKETQTTDQDKTDQCSEISEPIVEVMEVIDYAI